jgi:5-methylcytosine-specific restriction endonuclease McrA
MVKQRIHPKTYNCIYCNKESTYRVSKRNTYCSIQCQQDHGYKIYIENWLNGNKEFFNGGTNRTIKRYILEQQNHRCAKCGIDKWNNISLMLELEHKDGNSLNYDRDNLECLCPNCHSQTPTYKARNKGNGRHSRKMRYQEGKSF